LHRRYASPETPRTSLAAELLQQGVPRGDSRPGTVLHQWVASRTRHLSTFCSRSFRWFYYQQRQSFPSLKCLWLTYADINLPGMTNDAPADVATGSDPKVPTPSTKTAARTTKAAAAENATQPASTKTKTSIMASTKTATKATHEGPGDEPSSSTSSSSSTTHDGAMDHSSSDHKEDPTFHHSFRTGADPLYPEWYQTKTRTYIEETFQVPGSHRHHYLRPFVIRDAGFNRTLSSCSTGARQEAEVLYTLTASLGLQFNRRNDFLESHPKIDKAAREHLEEIGRTPWGFTSICWHASTSLKGYKETPKLKHSRRSSTPESDHSWDGAPSQRRRIKSTSPPIPGPRCLRKPPGSRGTRTTEDETSRRNPSRRTQTLSRPAPAGSNGLRLLRARRRPRRKEAAYRSGPYPPPLDQIRVLLPWTGFPRCGVRREYPLPPDDYHFASFEMDRWVREGLRRKYQRRKRGFWPGGVGFRGSWVQTTSGHRLYSAERDPRRQEGQDGSL
jgi:hypothetical protein